MATIPDGPAEQQGINAGEAAVAAMLAARQGDGFLAPFTPVIGADAGDWRPIGWPSAPVYDPDPWVGNLKPFLIESPSPFRPEGPNPLTSDEYAKDFNEVKELGALSSTKRTDAGRRLPSSGSSFRSCSGTRSCAASQLLASSGCDPRGGHDGNPATITDRTAVLALDDDDPVAFPARSS